MALALISPPLSAAITLDAVKNHLRIDGGDDDTYLTDLIAACSAHLEAVASIKLINQTWRVHLDQVPKNAIVRLPLAPVRSIVAVTVYDDGGNGQSVPLTALELDAVSSPPRLMFRDVPQPGRAMNGVEIDCVCGFGEASTDVPDTLKRALLLLIAHAYEFRGAIPINSQPASEPHGFRTLIAPFRRIGL